MKSCATRLLLASSMLATTVQAEVPVYRDQQFRVPSAVVVTDAGANYYGDVRFAANQDGSFTLVEATRRNLAQVEAASVVVDAASSQAVVDANGILSIACVALEEPAVLREGNTFHVVLAETPIDPLALCIALLAEFDVEVPLDLNGLEPGTYDVRVNGVTTSFVLNAK